MKKGILKLSAVLFMLSALLNACSEDVEDGSPLGPFEGYETWTVIHSYSGPRLSGAAHDTDPREIFSKNGALEVETDGELPIGSMLVKEIGGGVVQIVGMRKTKKGDTGWEYWDLKAGANLGASNFCFSCHETATTDYVFSVEDL
ncbi:hypothetical protein QWY31_07000 [Cytophagales bacterium LB-30]|uniref:Cytochrome P460 domain-containing protein n=1 Tax=Shiella aurantiaca TaxID=3058365 RepID=A0ABT8F465_9BACT|nr:hypothetical protein [Shiella aurantiaca]MDN4165241.1 hypothetical protein [Shiella aurantiaca]